MPTYNDFNAAGLAFFQGLGPSIPTTPPVAVTPTTANILSGSLQGTTGTIITVPSARWWYGSFSLSGTILNASSNPATLQLQISSTAGSGMTPTGQYLELDLRAAPAVLGSSDQRTQNGNITIGPMYIYGGASGGLIVAQKAGSAAVDLISASAAGVLL